MKLNTEMLRERVAEDAAKNIDSIVREFHERNEEAREFIRASVVDPRNWRRISKYRDDNDLEDNYGVHGFPPGSRGWMRVFDCRPLDDQLRCYVLSDPEDSSIVMINFEGE